jgi:hypothetical protein
MRWALRIPDRRGRYWLLRDQLFQRWECLVLDDVFQISYRADRSDQGSADVAADRQRPTAPGPSVAAVETIERAGPPLHGKEKVYGSIP